jgi:hypothetical protein
MSPSQPPAASSWWRRRRRSSATELVRLKNPRNVLRVGKFSCSSSRIHLSLGAQHNITRTGCYKHGASTQAKDQLAYLGSASSLGMTHIGGYRALTHLDLTVNHGGPHQNYWIWYYGEFLSSAASTPIELKIGFQYRTLTPEYHAPALQEGDLTCIFELA